MARGVPCITTMSGASAAQRAIRARREGQPEPVLAPGAAPRRRRGARAAASRRSSRDAGPPERRTAEVVGCERLGAYELLCGDRPRGAARPPAGPVLHARPPPSGGAGEPPSAPTCRARSPSHARGRTGGGIRLDFLLEDVGPGTERLAELEPGEGLALLGPLGIGFRPARDGRRPLLVGGGIGTAPLLCLSDELDGAAGAAGLPLGRPRRGRRAVRAARPGWPPTTARPAARAWSPSC